MDEWEYRPPPDISKTIAESLRSFPRQPGMLVYAIRSSAALLLRGWLRLYHRLEIDGADNLPDRGSFVLVCNHTSHLDTLCLLCAVPLRKIHRTFPAAAADYFFSSLPRSAVSAILINALPFDRTLKGAESLTVCAELLGNDGNVLIIFPEGTRTISGEMGRFRSGIGRLVAGTDLLVIPCHLQGGFSAWGKGKLFPRPHRLRLRIGKPRDYSSLAKTSSSVVEICRDLQDSVAELGRNEHNDNL
jgi:1-acyl-sn-glycerol-3-phosphate acyltransferase